MLNPAIGKLIRNNENRYRLVVNIAKRARKIAETAEEQNDDITDKPVSMAINQLAKDEGLI